MIRGSLHATFFFGLLASAVCLNVAAGAETLVLRGGSVYVSPDAAPLANAVVVASAGVISAVGTAGEIDIPDEARIIDCIGKTIVVGFWNSHVHFTERVWVDAGTAPAGPLGRNPRSDDASGGRYFSEGRSSRLSAGRHAASRGGDV